MPALLPQRVEFKCSELGNDKNKAALSCIFKNNFFQYPMATNSTDEVEMESARPQYSVSNQKSSLYCFTALCLMSCDQSKRRLLQEKAHSLQH